MSGKFLLEIEDCSILREIALNTVNPLEILREAISNCDDANGNQIIIDIDRDIASQLIISISDNGDGMDIDGLRKFFNLGFSKKELDKIGEKGVGAKIFYKSNSIIVETCSREGIGYVAKMLNPWEKLEKNELPEYEIKKCDKPIKLGTKITIVGYKVDNPEIFFNLDSIKDYITWFTIGGSFRNVFANNIRIRQLVNNIDTVPQITINDKINNRYEVIAGIHNFEQPNENPNIIVNCNNYRKSNEYARTFGPFTRETNINGEYVSIQLYGTISGINAKKKICKLNTRETYKSRFGLYLCKDFIPCIKLDSLIGSEEAYHYHLMANSQNFKLTSDRNNISNIDDIKVKWVLDQIKDIFKNQIKPIADREYFNMIKKEEDEYSIIKKCERTRKNINKLIKAENLGIQEIPIVKKPRNEMETALLFTSILSNNVTKEYIPDIDNILSYSTRTPTDMICLSNDKNILVEVELKLSNFFRHKHPIETVDYIICWNIDIEENKLYSINEESCVFIRENNCDYLAFNEKTIKLIELKKTIDKFNISTQTAL